MWDNSEKQTTKIMKGIIIGMKNLSVSRKLLVSFGVVLALAAVIGGVGIFGLISLGHGLDELYESAAPLVELGTARENFQSARGVIWEAILHTGDEEFVKKIERELDAQFAAFERNMRVYGDTITTDDAQYLFDDISNYFDNVIKPGFAQTIEAARQGASQEVLLEMIESKIPACERVTEELDQLFAMRDKAMRDTNASDQALANSLLVTIVIVIAAAMAVSVVLGVYVARSISKPLNILRGYLNDAGTKGLLEMTPEEKKWIPIYSQYKDEVGETLKASQKFFDHVVHIAEELEGISNGDLTVEVEVLSHEDVLGNSLLRMEDNLNEMFREIMSATEQVNSGSKQVSDGAQALAQGSVEQAASVEELSSSISEISGQTHENSRMAERAAELAGTIMGNAEKGNRQMEEMMTAVRDINTASQSISKVIKVIDDIAFQTNILALNAAVEAARAGQHGKGFAVVAEEVRNLAAKSAEAAKETGGLIQNSMEKAELGSRIATDTANSLSDIVAGINESSNLIREISRSSSVQSSGIQQINVGVEQVSQVIQQNSATAEESAAAAEEMSSQSALLEELITRFKIKR